MPIAFPRRALLAGSLALALGLATPAMAAEPPAERVLAADSLESTSAGASFTAPQGWRMRQAGNVVELGTPEAGSRVFLVDVIAKDGDSAVAQAWADASEVPKWKLKLAIDQPGRDGWVASRTFEYAVPANEERVVVAMAYDSGERWTVVLADLDAAVVDKRMAQLTLVVDRLMPKGKQRETFAGRKPLPLDAARLEALRDFIRTSQAELGIPGVSIGIVQDGEVVMAEGFGVRELGASTAVDADTLYMIASNTKAMTTLMLGRLVDAGRIDWDTPVVDLLPGFRLGDAATTAKVQVQHLVCACTGLPRQDYEWLMEFKDATPATSLATLATMQPTTGFGELYQYSNPLASAGGYVGAHVLYPGQPLGEAYDRAMQEQVFGPLGMAGTTFDMAKALAGNHAAPHGSTLAGQPTRIGMELNYSVVPLRPAGGAWSSVNDMLRYVRMELANGVALDGTRIASEAVIAERRKAKVAIGNDAIYGMGLETDTTWGVPVVKHGGSMFGYKSDMMWLPAHGVGAVILTNSEDGRPLLGGFQRRLLELLFDGAPEAAGNMAATAANIAKYRATEAASLVRPADAKAAAGLRPRYANAALGGLAVVRDEAGGVRFDFGEFSTEMATRANADKSLSFVSVEPGFQGMEFVADAQGRLVMRSPQMEYVFSPAP